MRVQVQSKGSSYDVHLNDNFQEACLLMEAARLGAKSASMRDASMRDKTTGTEVAAKTGEEGDEDEVRARPRAPSGVARAAFCCRASDHPMRLGVASHRSRRRMCVCARARSLTTTST